MKQILNGCLVAVILILILFVSARAEIKAEGETSVNPFKIEGGVIGRKISVDRAFAEKHQVEVPAPFEFIVPRDKNIAYFMAFPPEIKGAEYFRLSFATKEKKLVENLRMVDLTIPLVEREKRIRGTVLFLLKKALPMAFKGYEEPRYIGNRVGRVGPCDAVEVLGQYVDPAIGLVFVRLVAILNPDSEHAVLAVANINPALSEVKTPEDAARKGYTAKAIATFEFKPVKPSRQGS